jgi:hypothetical protein
MARAIDAIFPTVEGRQANRADSCPMTPDQLAAAVAAYGLTSAIALPDGSLPDGLWDDALDQLQSQRLIGLLAAAVRDGALPVTERQQQQLARIEAMTFGRVLQLEAAARSLSLLLSRSDIPHRLLKGSAVAHSDYPEPALRTFIDVDVLVPGACFDEAVHLLAQQGCTRRFPEIRPGFDRRFGKSATLWHPDGYEIDLHRTLVIGAQGLLMDTTELFASYEGLVLGGRTVPALRRPYRIVHACYHAALGHSEPRLVPLRDVAQMLLSTEDEGWREALDIANRWRGRAVLAYAIDSAWKTLQLCDDSAASRWARTYQPTVRERSLLATYTAADRPYARHAWDSLRVLPGLADRAAYLRAVLAPSGTTRAH